MTQNELKVAGRIGAELGAAKAENERLRAEVEALRVALLGIASANPAERGIEWAKAYASDGLSGTGSELYIRWLETFKEAEALRKDADRHATLSQQAEPTDAFTAVEMATAAAQGFRDGQAAVEPAAAQDEQPAVFWVLFDATGPERFIKKDVSDGTLAFFDSEDEAHRAKRRHPGTDYKRVEYYRAPIAQTAPLGKFSMGDLVKKSTGSEWEGRVVGTYSTEQTKEGYAVESSAHRNSVQIYPAKALEAVE